jgi:diazepam-binding inhibitor (GABA receptor modulating acyl-CoA-binding protein)
MELDKLFEEASIKAKELPNQSNENLLLLYALYKQASEGDQQAEKPSNPFDIIGNAKYKAWENLKGVSKNEAKKQYIDLVSRLKD